MGPKPEVSVLEEVSAIQEEDLGLRSWLNSLDPQGSLVQYHGVLAENFDSVVHVVDAYCEDGKLDPQFFEDCSIIRIGHRRKFEQWFDRHLAEAKKAQSLRHIGAARGT